MLVLKRKEGQWIEITHKSGDILRFICYNINNDRLNVAFEDGDRNFEINRQERIIKLAQ